MHDWHHASQDEYYVPVAFELGSALCLINDKTCIGANNDINDIIDIVDITM